MYLKLQGGGGWHFSIIDQSILLTLTLWHYLNSYMCIFYWVESTDVASLSTQLFCTIEHKTKVVWKELGGGGGLVLGRPLFKIGFHVKMVKHMCNIGGNAKLHVQKRIAMDMALLLTGTYTNIIIAVKTMYLFASNQCSIHVSIFSSFFVVYM